MDRNRLLELALEELQRERAGIDAEIEAIRAELKGTGSAVRHTASAGTRRGRMATAAQRREHSEKMKQYWARKKAQAGKSVKDSKPAPIANVKEEKIETKKLAAPVTKAKAKKKSPAEKKVLSLVMKKAWQKRKAAKKGKTKGVKAASPKTRQ